MNTFAIAASLLSADFARLGAESQAVLDAGADWLHLDIMDNHYVPNLTFGAQVCQALRDYGIQATFDVHLMVSPVDELIRAFAKAGATYITIHPEATHHVDRSLQLIRDLGCKAGVSLNPATPVYVLDHIWEKLDMILLMSVNPGFGNQKFIPSVCDKIQQVRQLLDAKKYTCRLEVDGGVKADNIGELAKLGADTFVVGSGIFSEPNRDYVSSLKKLRAGLEAS